MPALTQQVPAAEDSEDSESDPEYMPRSDDSGENSEVIELRRHARKFKKKMRDTRAGLQINHHLLYLLSYLQIWRNK